MVAKIANRDRRVAMREKGIIRALARPKGRWECVAVGVSIFANHPDKRYVTVEDRSRILAQNLTSLAEATREDRRSRTLAADRTLQALVADLVAARAAVCMTQGEVAARMGTTKSVVSRLESGTRTRPTLRSIERYALAVGASVEIRVRTDR
ncbi:MAG: helix-turn-helix transcriptional regulator [Betaproteobacteria bacterium]